MENAPSLSYAILVALAGGGGIMIAKLLDYFISRSTREENKQQLMSVRQKELDNVRDNLISIFQSQITDLRREIDALIEKNQRLHEDNIKLRYEVADCKIHIRKLEEKLGIENHVAN